MSNICDILYTELVKVEKPSRYLGAETNVKVKTDFFLHIMLCFPDIYEIGMSNNAMRLLYSNLNRNSNIFCERVFSPAEDFAKILVKKNILLYGLESHSPIINADILAFTIGYELAATNILQILELSGIPLDKSDRNNTHPIVIGGGPGITNPIPFTNFFDAVWIGEAEDEFFILCDELSEMKRKGYIKSDLLSKLSGHPSFWIPGKVTIRNIDSEFSSRLVNIDYPLPVIKPIQDHGVVEIMRGCPNGCRFCQAGFLYRPCRYKNINNIIKEIEALVSQGFRVITLTSLSSGDFPGIFELLDFLNQKYIGKQISFQLPSLKIESFSIDIIERLTKTKKSGLTFAVETPIENWQYSINKISTIDKISSILAEAEKYGYKQAKFYFMIGLPVQCSSISEEDAIIEFIKSINRKIKINLNITIATFVPKPHTPYQKIKQISLEDSTKAIYKIKDAFKTTQSIKITYHSPLMSAVEGLIARGDSQIGEAILKAYALGCRFDAWDDNFNKKVWLDILTEYSTKTNLVEKLPWNEVVVNFNPSYIESQNKYSENQTLTPPCSDLCSENCGACTDKLSVVNKLNTKINFNKHLNSLTNPQFIPKKNDYKNRTKLLFKFSKNSESSFFAHQDIWRLISYAFFRSGLMLEYTQGFTPLVHMEISEPLPLGASSNEEYGIIYINEDYDSLLSVLENLLDLLNSFLPESITILQIKALKVIEGVKNISLSAIYWGAVYELKFIDTIKSADSFLKELLILKEKNINILKNLTANSIDSGIEITLPFLGKKEFGIQGLIVQILGLSFRESGLALCRKKQYAIEKDTGKNVEYFSMYPQNN